MRKANMKQRAEIEISGSFASSELNSRTEIDRINAKLRHFRGVAASVMGEAMTLWKEIWDEVKDPRTCDEILEGSLAPVADRAERTSLLEKLHILGIKIDYARRLCEGDPGGKPRFGSED